MTSQSQPFLTRKRAIGIALLSAALALGGCMREATSVAPTDAYRVHFGPGSYNYVSVFTDPDTGCDYWMTDDGFLSPRLTPDGSQLCRVRAKVGG